MGKNKCKVVSGHRSDRFNRGGANIGGGIGFFSTSPFIYVFVFCFVLCICIFVLCICQRSYNTEGGIGFFFYALFHFDLKPKFNVQFLH